MVEESPYCSTDPDQDAESIDELKLSLLQQSFSMDFESSRQSKVDKFAEKPNYGKVYSNNPYIEKDTIKDLLKDLESSVSLSYI